VSKPPNIERIAELTKRLEEMCREAQFIRERINNLSSERPVWPNDRNGARLFERGDAPADFTSAPQNDEDRN
jgi:hypothetical protein